MIAMKYGTVPVVRATGGLADTVFDRDYSSRPVDARTGYVFHHANYIALDSALRRPSACGTFIRTSSGN